MLLEVTLQDVHRCMLISNISLDIILNWAPQWPKDGFSGVPVKFMLCNVGYTCSQLIVVCRPATSSVSHSDGDFAVVLGLPLPGNYVQKAHMWRRLAAVCSMASRWSRNRLLTTEGVATGLCHWCAKAIRMPNAVRVSMPFSSSLVVAVSESANAPHIHDTGGIWISVDHVLEISSRFCVQDGWSLSVSSSSRRAFRMPGIRIYLQAFPAKRVGNQCSAQGAATCMYVMFLSSALARSEVGF